MGIQRVISDSQEMIIMITLIKITATMIKITLIFLDCTME